MTWLDNIRGLVFRPGESLESSDRRALLFGATVTAAGLLVPKAIVSAPARLYQPPTLTVLSIDRAAGIITLGEPVSLSMDAIRDTTRRIQQAAVQPSYMFINPKWYAEWKRG